MGPEGGSGGGQIVAVGTPEEIAANPASHTGHWLAPVLHLPTSKVEPELQVTA
jgi:excinuclease ABC subunit A